MTDQLGTLATTFVGAAGVTFVLTPLVAGVARKLGVLDHPGARRVHARPVPRVGGAAVFGGLAVAALMYGMSFGWETIRYVESELLAFLLPCLLVLAIGLVDDVRGLSPTAKLLGQAVAATFLIQAGYVIDDVANPFGAPIALRTFAFPVTLLWFIAITNAFNLIDGIDGLLTMVAISALLGCAAIAVHGDRNAIAMLSLALAGALAGFLPWNWNPARVFLGDSGSLVVGLAVAALSIKVCRNPPNPQLAPNGTLALHAPLLLCALPIAETCLTVARRYMTGQPFFAGDKSHIHHVLLNKGLSVRGAALRLAAISALFSASAALSRSWRRELVLGWLVALLVIAALGLRWLGYIELRVFLDRIRHGLRRRRPELPMLVAMARAGENLAAAQDVVHLVDALRPLVGESGFAVVAVEVDPDLLPAGERTVEARCPEAAEQVAARGDRNLVLLSRAAEPNAPPSSSVTYRLSLALLEGRYAQLVCLHARVAGTSASSPSESEVSSYLADSLAGALRRLIWNTGSAVAVGRAPTRGVERA